MEPAPKSAGMGPAPVEAYLWAPTGKDASVTLDLDVVDRMLADVMRGFGVMPKRGVEVGGVLLGEFTGSGGVRVTDYELVSCQHTRGSSWLLSAEETDRLRAVCDRWLSSPGGHTTVIGLFRSHTREGFQVTPEDADLLDRMAPDPSSVYLLVKPYATRVSVAGFYFREDGGIRTMGPPYLEFPFRRRELAGEESTPGMPAAAVAPQAASVPSAVPAQPEFSFGGYNQGESKTMTDSISSMELYKDDASSATAAEAAKKRRTSGWVWLPLSFVFLLLGVVLGFQVALSVGQKMPSALRPPDPYQMNLTASRSGSSVHISWDRSAPAIQSAPRGVLHIMDGETEQRVELDALQLMNGSVLYRRAAKSVKFRLEVFTSNKVTLSETAEFITP